ncbi:hypothetical protein [uncultured Oscillibacter sp.]|uniref:hypothetical protein n=1 Tax=uncultured Oscillibacter sp. TaxID=876091 RepID=UPI0026175D83|nr:hypothetical protein [uncultured Oscillibacter sp.]
MRKLFRIYAVQCEHSAELELPATDYELLDLMERLGLEPGQSPYLAIQEHLNPDYSYDYLLGYIPNPPNLFQLNALAKKLSELSRVEDMAAFEGLVGMEIKSGVLPVPVPRLIDFAHSTNCCHVAEDVDTDYKLGRFLAENDFIPEAEGLSDAAFELLNFAKIGREHREREGSVFTGFGYVEQHDPVMEVFKTLDLTPKTPNYTILAETFSGSRVEFPFPANEPMGTEPVRCVDCAAPALIGLSGGMEAVDLLARRLAGLEPTALATYKALLEVTECQDIQDAGQLMDTLDEYIFSPQYSSPVEVAKGELSVVLCEEDAATLLPHLNLYQYGQALIQKCGGAMTPYGLLEKKDAAPVISEQDQQKLNGMEMNW